MADPLYRQIAQDLMRKIDLGALPPGARLANEEALKYEYKASRTTIRDALRWLSIRGLLVSRPGLGTYVARRPVPFVTTLLEDHDLPEDEPSASRPAVEVMAAPASVAERLRIDADHEVIARHQEFHVGPRPWSLQTTYYPMDLLERGATALLRPQDITEGTIEYLRSRLGLEQCGSRLRILVRAPNANEARFFGLPDDGRISVVSLIRTGYEDKGDDPPRPFRVTFTVLPADRNQFVVNSRQVPGDLAAPARDQ